MQTKNGILKLQCELCNRQLEVIDTKCQLGYTVFS